MCAGCSGGLSLAEGLSWGSLERRITGEGGTTARTRPPEWALCLVTEGGEKFANVRRRELFI